MFFGGSEFSNGADEDISFPNSIRVFKDLILDDCSFAALIDLEYIPFSPLGLYFGLHSLPGLFFSYLQSNECTVVFTHILNLLPHESDANLFEVDFRQDLIRFIDGRDIISFYLYSSINIFKKLPTLFGEQLIAGSRKKMAVGVLLIRLLIVEYVVRMLCNLELGYRPRILSLALVKPIVSSVQFPSL